MKGRVAVVTSTAKRTSAKKAAPKTSPKPVKTAAKKTASKTAAVKQAATKTASKTAPAKKVAAKVAPAKKTTVKAGPAAKGAAKKTATKAAGKVTVRKIGAPRRRPDGPGKEIFFEGKPAHNRHFEVSRENEEAAREAADENGHSLSEVMRAGLIAYAAKTPIAATRSEGKTSMPAVGVRGLKAVFKSGQSDLISGYMAALAGEGWPLQVIADSTVEHGLADRMSRQAVSLRVNKALKGDFKWADGDLPDVPAIGLRRPYPTVQSGGGTKALAESKGGRLRSDLKDVTVRIADEDYARVQVRAKYEHAKVAAILDDLLARYASGQFKLKKLKQAAG